MVSWRRRGLVHRTGHSGATGQKLRAVSLSGRVRDVATFPVPIDFVTYRATAACFSTIRCFPARDLGKARGRDPRNAISPGSISRGFRSFRRTAKCSSLRSPGESRLRMSSTCGTRAMWKRPDWARVSPGRCRPTESGFLPKRRSRSSPSCRPAPESRARSTLVPWRGSRQAGFFPDGRRIAISGNEKGHPLAYVRCWTLGGKPRPLTPEKLAGAAVSPDGKWILVSETVTISDSFFRPRGANPALFRV